MNKMEKTKNFLVQVQDDWMTILVLTSYQYFNFILTKRKLVLTWCAGPMLSYQMICWTEEVLLWLILCHKCICSRTVVCEVLNFGSFKCLLIFPVCNVFIFHLPPIHNVKMQFWHLNGFSSALQYAFFNHLFPIWWQ